MKYMKVVFQMMSLMFYFYKYLINNKFHLKKTIYFIYLYVLYI